MRTGLLALLLAAFVGLSVAQTSGGQLCVRAFEDRNANGIQDANEPPLTRGVSATLANAQGVIIDSALMESSQNASSGTLCFQRLAAGQYTMSVTSADYTATTISEYVAGVSDTGVPQVFTYGAQLIPIQTGPVAAESAGDFSLTPAEQRALILRLLFATIGALLIMGVMAVVGALLYFVFLRNRQSASRPATSRYAPVAEPPPATGDTPVSGKRDTEPRPSGVTTMYDDTSPPRPTSAQAKPRDPYGNVDDDFEFEDDPDS